MFISYYLLQLCLFFILFMEMYLNVLEFQADFLLDTMRRWEEAKEQRQPRIEKTWGVGPARGRGGGWYRGVSREKRAGEKWHEWRKSFIITVASRGSLEARPS